MLPKPCQTCGTPIKGQCPRCGPGRPRTPRRDTRNRQARGYDAEYDRNRRLMIEQAWANRMPCVICSLQFEQKSDISAEHLIAKRDGGSNARENLAPAHKRCNSGWRKYNPSAK